MEKLIGREEEIRQLDIKFSSGKPEFVAVYGRRRVGKTFLVMKYFNRRFDFYVSGILQGDRDVQMERFYSALADIGYSGEMPKTWFQMFRALGKTLEGRMTDEGKRCVIFIDEVSSLDTQNSDFVLALGDFWNSWASWRDNVMLVICASATSWMVRKVFRDKGGLHGRVTGKIHVRPFSLRLCDEYFNEADPENVFDRIGILQIYSAVGGVPYYLSKIDTQKSVAENIDALFFSEDREMVDEYRQLYQSIYRQPRRYMDVVSHLAVHNDGMTREEILHALGLKSGRNISQILEDLENCDIVRRFRNGLKKNAEIFQLVDMYTIFYNKFCRGRSTDRNFWQKESGGSIVDAWYGFAFERICLMHIWEVIHALRLDAMRIEYYS